MNLDPRIGILCREGAYVFYAYPNGPGRGASHIEGSLADVEVALGLRAAKGTAVVLARKARRVCREFIVTVSPRVESWNVKRYQVTVTARTHAEAIRVARREYGETAGWTNGAATYRARIA